MELPIAQMIYGETEKQHIEMCFLVLHENIQTYIQLTVCPEEVVEQLEERKAVPALRGLDLQSGIHVYGVEGQEVFCMLHHEVRPPCKCLETQQGGGTTN